MRKLFLLITFAAALASASQAADFSLSGGTGGFIGRLFTRYTLEADGQISGDSVSVVSNQEVNESNFGGFLFFDATWVEFSLGIQGGFNTYAETTFAESSKQTEIDENNTGTGSERMFVMALLGKYPFKLHEKFTLFPLAGIEYQITLLEYRKPADLYQYDRTDGVIEFDINNNAYGLSAWNSLFIDIGAGLDYSLILPLYIRTEFIYAFRLQTRYEADALEKVKKLVSAPDPHFGGLTSGPTLKVSVGYRL
jgi:opacity protein-like surface antigen